jgi:hypothetical protein
MVCISFICSSVFDVIYISLDGILTLVQMMQKDNPRLREFSTLAMSNLTQSNPNNIRYIIEEKGMKNFLIKYVENYKIKEVWKY